MRVYLSLLAILSIILVSALPVCAGWVQDQYGGRHWVNDVQPNAYGQSLNMGTHGLIWMSSFPHSHLRTNQKRKRCPWECPIHGVGMPIYPIT